MSEKMGFFLHFNCKSMSLLRHALSDMHGSSKARDIKKIFSVLKDLLISLKLYFLVSIITRRADAHARLSLQLGTTAVGTVTLPPLVLAPLPLAWDQRTKILTEEHHPMPCWPCRAAAAGIQLVARLSRSSCISLQLQI